jgi:hypothetical protein
MCPGHSPDGRFSAMAYELSQTALQKATSNRLNEDGYHQMDFGAQ